MFPFKVLGGAENITRHRFSVLWKIIAGIRNGRKPYTGPLKVQIDPTNLCNMKCIACWFRSPFSDFQIDIDWSKRRLSLDIFTSLIKDLHKLGTQIVELVGNGEPFMHPQILDMVELIKRTGMRCLIRTNGSLLNRKLIKELFDLKLDGLDISLWAGSPKTYIKMHPGKSEETFYYIKDCLLFINKLKSKYIKNKMRLTIINVITSKNYDDIFQMVKCAESVMADYIFFQCVDVLPSNKFLLLDRIAIDSIKEEIPTLIKESKVKNNIKEFISRISFEDGSSGKYDKGLPNYIPCYIGWVYARILVDGKVVPCCGCTDLTMGNLSKNSFEETWFSQQYELFRRNTKKRLYEKQLSQCNCYKNCIHYQVNETIHSIISRFPTKMSK